MSVPTKTCVICGESYQPATMQRWRTAKTCSYTCRGKLTSQTKMAKTKGKTMACVVCSKEFWAYPSRIKEGIKYCSTTCMGEAQKIPLVQCAHPECSNEFTPKIMRVAGERKKYCSPKCSYAAPQYKQVHRERMLGEKNHSWRGGRSKMNGRWYIKNYDHPLRTKSNYVAEHRFIVEQALLAQEPDHHFLMEVDGVKVLDLGIEVHHLNQDRTDNASDNLVAMTAGAHRMHHSSHDYTFREHEVWPRDRINQLHSRS